MQLKSFLAVHRTVQPFKCCVGISTISALAPEQSIYFAIVRLRTYFLFYAGMQFHHSLASLLSGRLNEKSRCFSEDLTYSSISVRYTGTESRCLVQSQFCILLHHNTSCYSCTSFKSRKIQHLLKKDLLLFKLTFAYIT